jgi:hypothetical protein
MEVKFGGMEKQYAAQVSYEIEHPLSFALLEAP